jgi:hypothetical protein
MIGDAYDMGKGDRHIQRQQELMQRSSLMNTLKNRPIPGGNWLSFVDDTNAIEGRTRLASDLVRKKKHR